MKTSEYDVRAFLTEIIEQDIRGGLLERLRQKPCIYDMCSDIIEHDKLYLSQHASRFAEITKLIPQANNLKILDVGAGVGFLSILLRNRYGHSVEAVDLRESVSFWKERFEEYGINQKAVDIAREPLPYAEGYFDVVILSEVIEHLPALLNRPLAETKRVLKANGCLIITTPNFGRFRNIAALTLGRNIFQEISEGGIKSTPRTPHIREYTLGELKTALNNVGFSVDKIHMSRCFDKRLMSALLLVNNIVTSLCPMFRSCIMIRAKKLE